MIGIAMLALALAGLLGLSAGGLVFFLGKALWPKASSFVAVIAFPVGILVAAISSSVTLGLVVDAQTSTYIAIDSREGEKRLSHLNPATGQHERLLLPHVRV